MLISLEKLLFSNIRVILKIKEKTSAALKRLGLEYVRDLLFYFPNTYQHKALSPDLVTVREGELIQTRVVIESIIWPTLRNQPLKIITTNDTGSIILVFFHKLPQFILNKLKIGSSHIISGKVQFFDNNLQVAHPEFLSEHKFTNNIEPIYSLTYALSNKQLHSYIIKVIEIVDKKLKVLQLEPEVKNYLISLLIDLKILHCCTSDAYMDGSKGQENNIHDFTYSLKKQNNLEVAVSNLAFKELTANQLSLFKIRKEIHSRQGNMFYKDASVQKQILDELGFELTNFQRQVIEEIERDQSSSYEMMRLLQGDVGSGKTLVALLTMINAVSSKFQSCLMAPTDLLANQHYEFFQKALKNIKNIKLALLTGKTQGSARKEIMKKAANGEIDILIGTHALFQERVIFQKLGYIVIDEQHKFGVQQRLNLINKGVNPDVLVMTATPIPRSLALTMFGDMSISKLEGKPKNRLHITTTTISTQKMDYVIESLGRKLDLGEQIYWICPLVDKKELSELVKEDDNMLMDVESRFKSIELVHRDIVGIIHGKMKNEQKDAIMQQFKEGKIKILVATTVIEVGIDVPQSSLIIIENAEQFGLAQLHQLRGRVGRGNVASYCILLYNPKRLSKVAHSRFSIMKQTNNGFYIAEQDLKLRGSGEILGIRQSGEVRFYFAELSRDEELLVKANRYAKNCLNDNIRSDFDFINFQIKLFSRSELTELN